MTKGFSYTLRLHTFKVGLPSQGSLFATHMEVRSDYDQDHDYILQALKVACWFWAGKALGQNLIGMLTSAKPLWNLFPPCSNFAKEIFEAPPLKVGYSLGNILSPSSNIGKEIFETPSLRKVGLQGKNLLQAKRFVKLTKLEWYIPCWEFCSSLIWLLYAYQFNLYVGIINLAMFKSESYDIVFESYCFLTSEKSSICFLWSKG